MTRFWRAALAVSSLIQLYILYTPSSGPEPPFRYADKLVHVLIFAVVAYTGRKARVPVGGLTVVLVLNAVVSELVQHQWLHARSGDPYDTLADLAGVLAGLFLAGGRLPRTT